MKDRVTITMLEDGVADVRLVRIDKMNALDNLMFAGIAEAIAQLKEMKGLRVVVLSGEGRAFCAGLDLTSLGQPGDGKKQGEGATGSLGSRSHGIANLAQYVAWGWRELPVPVIAAVHGVAFGGGFQIMSGADIRIIHPDTRCAIMEMKWGLVPDMAGFPLWRGNVRDDVIRELTYTNREFKGTEAHALGFATKVSDTPLEDAFWLAKVMAGKHPAAMRGAKRLCNAMADATDAELLALESAEQLKVIRTPNQIEAVMAEMQKRRATFAE
ncbi:MAG: crotonase/enoyl-CoA hydratase family protein [Hyphomonas sp.]|uniref:crotonase/enoyl-CoA hydratase family protein n=1 Tax=Hyphomonas sp. TaxID=87 RepID=UPI00184B9A8C|nr:crotonase/enoyl-CoA hydratase family protein [Hyphomonas sp.]MBU3919125.1 crotonase/enoyl-CoA hydratase family protein [Alphaproteobacteria bacterium]MBA3068595.1 crotonase/enoyl-CoA hydratase family protein [Hyphomonas sp.]MBU4061914.1 crotonase/enoyl-CoA hydratase family protein [Alphaproteobacteria bacterium]MBU4166069.1 crotonase/enoyl-CoA hydratase family protein [Alphaproteobacteria bacterium]MBU4568791.1 crotonase/enoyl-CoA hydratase family protein [Alphaproteobacteria bacterium]